MPSKTLPNLSIIIGPTASGKTDFGIKLAKLNNGAVISCDSRQVYAGMNIGTGTPLRPTGSASLESHEFLVPDIVAGIDHYLLNISPPDKVLTLELWQQYAFTTIEHILDKSLHPYLVGGTMLYADSIINNYIIPAVPRDEIYRTAQEEKPTEQLFQELIKKDIAAKKFIEPNNRRRIIRALEVINATGQPFSMQRKKASPRYEMKTIGIFPGWESLQNSIRDRANKMFNEGLIDETKTLQETYGTALPLLKTRNYLQASQVIAGKISIGQAIDEMTRSDMRYAHRQMSWFKKMPRVKWVNSISTIDSLRQLPNVK